jgi:hypothetical protein
MRFRDLLAPCLLFFALLAQLPSAAQNGTATTSQANCRALGNSVVPGACLWQFQYGTLVRKIGSGANEVLGWPLVHRALCLPTQVATLSLTAGLRYTRWPMGSSSIPSRTVAIRTSLTSATW